MIECFLIRHAKSQPDLNMAESLWPLSEAGREQAHQLKDQLASFGIQRIFSSPYPRAIDTVAPLADALGLKVELRHDLRERKLAENLIDTWLQELEKTWQDFNYHLPGGESNAVCQQRVMSCLSEVLQDSSGLLKVAVSSHGNAIALMMNAIDPVFRFEHWKDMGNPHVFKIVWTGDALKWDKQFKLQG